MSLSLRVAGIFALLSCPTLLVSQAEPFEVIFQHGAEALRDGRLAAAAEDFSKCTEARPNFAEAYFNLGLVRLQQGRSDDAANLFSKSLKLQPNLRGAQLFLGMARYRLDEYSEAEAALRRAVELAPANADALLWLGMAELATGNTTASIESLEKASKLKPEDVDILYHLGRAYMQVSKETYERMYRADPNSWRVHQVLAESFVEADRLDDAAKECGQAIGLRPNEPGLHQQLGDIYWKGNHLEQAEAEYEAELKIDPQNFTSMYDLAAVNIERSKPQMAANLLGNVLKKHPESREAHYQLGRAEAQLGNNDAAIHEFSAVVNGSGTADPEILRQSYYQLSQLYRRTQHPEEARLALSSFLRLKQQADAQQDQKLQDKLKRSTEPQQP